MFETLLGTPFLSADARAPRGRGLARAARARGGWGSAWQEADSFARASGRIALATRRHEARLDRRLPARLLDREGRRLSFVDLDELRAILRDEPLRGDARRAAMLREIEAVLTAGLPAVNLCSLAGLADELFTYAGSGTLFSRERYVVVRRLGIDDFDAAADLIARGVAEGYLAPRSPEQIERVLDQRLRRLRGGAPSGGHRRPAVPTGRPESARSRLSTRSRVFSVRASAPTW